MLLLSRLPFNFFSVLIYLLLILSLFIMNIYISNLSYGINDTDLNQLFAEYGGISSAKVIMDGKPVVQEVSVS